MKKLLLLLLSITMLVPSTFARKIKITCDHEDAKIYIDGSFLGEGAIFANVKKGEFIQVKIEKEGYVPIKTRINESAKQKSIGYTLRIDEFYQNSFPSGNANKFFTINISEDYIKRAGDKDKAAILVWKQLHQILLSYFDEIEKSDQLGGFIQTNWKYKSYPTANKQVRTRVSIQQSNIGGDLTYKVKISSEEAYSLSNNSDENFQETSRILKEYEPMISEFQSRLGKL